MAGLPPILQSGAPVNWAHHLNRGLVSWYKILPLRSGGMRWWDLCGRNPLLRTAMATNSGTSGWGATTRLGGAGEMRHDGTDDYTTTATAKGLPIGATAPFTIVTWCKPLLLSDGIVLFGYGELDSNLSVSGNARFLIRFNAHVYFWGGGADVEASSVDYTLGVWQMVAATYDGTNVVLYKNGVSLTATGNPPTLITAPSFIFTGKKGTDWAWQLYYQGSLDSMRIYTRALPASEIKGLYVEDQKVTTPLLNYMALPFGVAAAAVTKARPPFHRPLRIWRKVA